MENKRRDQSRAAGVVPNAKDGAAPAREKDRVNPWKAKRFPLFSGLAATILAGGLFGGFLFLGKPNPGIDLPAKPSPSLGNLPTPQASLLREEAENTEIENAAFPAGSGKRTERVSQSADRRGVGSAKTSDRPPAKVNRFPKEPNRANAAEFSLEGRGVRGERGRRRTSSDDENGLPGAPAIRRQGAQELREVLGKSRESGEHGVHVAETVVSKEAETASGRDRLSADFAPYGRLIKCELVLTVDSLNLQTPIVALVMEDVWWNGNLIIPAGTEAFSKVNPNSVRDRIGDDGVWTFVLPEQDERINGRELILKGFAIDRAETIVEENGRVRSWNLNDGSAGLHGYYIDDSDPEKIKLFLATALSGAISGFAEGLETREPIPGAAGALGLTELKSTLHNASVHGLSLGAKKSLDVLAEDILEQIKKNKSYVRVPSGKQFYVFVDQSIDPHAAQVGLRLLGVSKRKENLE